VRVAAGGGASDSLALARPTAPLAAMRPGTGTAGQLGLDAPFAARALAWTSLLATAGAFVAGRMRDRASRDPRRRRQVAIDARLAELRAARASDPLRAAAVASLALRDAAAWRHEVIVEGLPLQDSLATLERAGASEEEIRTIREVLESLDRMAFAPDHAAEPGSPGGSAIDEADRLIRRYREEVSR
jgi:hypothetical protein